MRRALSATLLPLCALLIGACANTTSTSSFKGTEHEVAQVIANLQSDVTSSEKKKVCSRDLAAPVVSKLGGQTSCEAAVKERLTEIDNTELSVESVKVSGSQATASVKSVFGGKKKLSTVALVKESGGWKISALQ